MKTLALTAALSLATAAPALAQSVLLETKGTGAYDRFGQSAVFLNDLDNDGHPEIAIGSPGDDTIAPAAGRVAVLSGQTGGVLYDLFGSFTSEEFGATVANVGDVNGDGFEDLAVGAPGHHELPDPAVGRVDVISGATGVTLWSVTGDSQMQRLGTAIAGGGDASGDGVPDVVVGDPLNDFSGNDQGMVHCYSGATGQELWWLPSSPFDHSMGRSVDIGPDVNNDGKADVLVGAGGDAGGGAESGLVFVLSGTGQVLNFITGVEPSHDFGVAVRWIDDVDQDLTPDFVVGSPNKGSSNGEVRAFSGATQTLLYARTGQPGDSLGHAIAPCGDWDGDGTPDFVVGSPDDDDHGNGAGTVRVYGGTFGSLLHTFHGDQASDELGASVDGGFDLNGDGSPDVLAGGPGIDGAGSQSGAIRVYGADTCPTITPFGQGCPGAGGFVPLLEGFGCPVSNEELRIEVSSSLGGETALVLPAVKAEPSALPSGCVLEVVPFGPPIFIPVFGPATPGLGFTKVSSHLPQIAVAFDLYIQVAVSDPTAQGGFVLTRALTIPVTP